MRIYSNFVCKKFEHRLRAGTPRFTPISLEFTQSKLCLLESKNSERVKRVEELTLCLGMSTLPKQKQADFTLVLPQIPKVGSLNITQEKAQDSRETKVHLN